MFDIITPDQDVLVFLAILSAVFSTLAFLPYIVDTINRQTEPQRATWLIWSVLSSISFFSLLHEGGTQALWFAGAQVAGNVAILLLAITRGHGAFFRASDFLVLLAAQAGLVLWYQTDNAVYALGISIAISLAGGLLTIVKAYRAPETETASTWVLLFLSSAASILSIGKIDWVQMAYPLYVFALSGTILLAILVGRASAKPVALGEAEPEDVPAADIPAPSRPASRPISVLQALPSHPVSAARTVSRSLTQNAPGLAESA